MSNFKQGATAVVGGVIGFFAGGPTGAAYGFQIGLLAGSALFPTQLGTVTGPRLEDLRTTTAELGAGVPIPFGTIAVPGEVMWLGPIVEHESTDTVGGKGAPTQNVTAFSYTQSIAIGLGEPILGIRRIWENGKIVFDTRPQQDGESDQTYAQRIAQSGTYAATFQLYLGTETQQPDPTIEAIEGVGEVPPFLGLAYVIYHDRQLRDDQARRHPNFKFELSQCVDEFQTLVVFTDSGTWNKPAQLLNVSPLCIGGGGGGQAGSSQLPDGVGLAVGGHGGGGGGAGFDTIDADDLPSSVTVTVGTGGQGAPENSTPLSFGQPGENGDDSSFGNFVVGGGGYGGANNAQSGGPGNLAKGGDGGAGAIDGGDGVDTSGDPGGGDHHGRPAGAGGGGGSGGTQFGGFDGGKGGNGEQDPDGPPFGAAGGLGGTLGDGNHVPPILAGPGFAGTPSLINHGGGGGGGGGGARNGYGNTGGPGGRHGGGGGGGGGSTVGGTGGPGGPGAKGAVIVAQSFGDADPCESSHSLAAIVTEICARVGLTAADIDVTDLEDIRVEGFVITRPMPARSALEPLRSVGFFDVVETGGVVKFTTRGKDSVADLSLSDLGAVESGSEAPPAVTCRLIQDVELPRSVSVRYLAPSRDYEFGFQSSPSRLTTDAVNDITVDLTVALDDDRGRQIAHVLWADSWAAKRVHDLAVDSEWLPLDSADCIAVPIDGRVQRVRIGPIEEAALLLRRISAVRDDRNGYTSKAVALPPERQPQHMTIYSGTELVLLDLPALRDVDDDAGIYAAAYPDDSGNTWRGAVVRRSIDGENYTDVANMGATAYVGTIVQPPASGDAGSWDESAFIDVDMLSGALESRTEAAVIAGANFAAIGRDGNWLLVQFRDAEEISIDRWRLTGLLQGRRGTEHLIGTVLAGDRFVLMSGPGITRIALDFSQIALPMLYRAITRGTSEATGIEQTFTGHAIALKPFSPVQLESAEDGSGNVTLTWIRRARLGQELPGGVDIALYEATEAWEIDVVYGPNVVRTLTSTAATATYTAAQRATDGTTDPSLLGYRVYQISAAIGRGTPGLLNVGPELEPEAPPQTSGPRSDDLSYLEYIKGPYPGGNPSTLLEWRERFDGYVVDVQQQGIGGLFSVIRFDDGEEEDTGGFGVYEVVDVYPDSGGRFFFLAVLNDGLGSGLASQGSIRRIDSQAMIPGGLISGAQTHRADVALAGDPESVVQIGAFVYAACPYEGAIRKYHADDLSLAAVLTPPVSIFTVLTDGTNLYGLQRARPARLYHLNKSTAASLFDFAVSDFPIDGKVTGGFAYVVCSDDSVLRKWQLSDGAQQAFEYDLSAETFGSLRNYLTLDGTRLSVGRDNPRVLDTTTDTFLT